MTIKYQSSLKSFKYQYIFNIFRPKGAKSKKLKGFTVNEAKFFRIEPGFVTQCGMQPLDNNASQKENCLDTTQCLLI